MKFKFFATFATVDPRRVRLVSVLAAVASMVTLAACQTTGSSDKTLASLPNASDTPSAPAVPPVSSSANTRQTDGVGTIVPRRIGAGVMTLKDDILDKLAPHQATILRLRRAKVAFKRIPDLQTKRGCGYVNGVEMTGVDGIPFTASATIRSALALRFAVWIKDTVEPAARQVFDQQIKKIVVWSSYSCRNAKGRRWGGMWHRLSQHAHGNAIDLGGFILADGTFVAFRAHWYKKGPKSTFLKSITAAACRQFSKVLTPDYDRVHANHLHLDLAKGKLCGMKKPTEKLLDPRISLHRSGKTGRITWIGR